MMWRGSEPLFGKSPSSWELSTLIKNPTNPTNRAQVADSIERFGVGYLGFPDKPPDILANPLADVVLAPSHAGLQPAHEGYLRFRTSFKPYVLNDLAGIGTAFWEIAEFLGTLYSY